MFSNISSSDSIDNANIIEAISKTNRKLASVQRIVSISEIPGADRIEVAQVLGWQCVVAKKDNFKVGDLVVYIETDSVLPQLPVFEFLRERKFRVRTIKLRKQISEGLIMPLSILPLETEQFCGNMLVTWNNMKGKEAEDAKKIPIEEGLDLTNIIGVIKHDPEGKLEQSLIEKEKRGPVMRFAMGIPAFRWLYLKLNSNIKGNFPPWIAKSDENRIQTYAKLIMEHYDEEWEITEKLDGQSATFFVHPMKVWGRKKVVFGVCSRNIWMKTPSDNKYWQSAKKFKVKESLLKTFDNVYIQAEQCGPGIQANKYKLQNIEIYVFNLVIDGCKAPYKTIAEWCKDQFDWNKDVDCLIKPVPLVKDSFIPAKEIGNNKSVMEVVQYMVNLSQGDSALLPRPREGIVCRLKSNPNISLKIINPLFKIEQEKEEDKEDKE